jgi:hypothetical protein
LPSAFGVPKTINSYRTPPKPQDKAVLALASWSDACGIEWRKSQSADLCLISTTGQALEVAIVVEPGQTMPPGALPIPAWDLTSSNREVAFAAFHRVTEKLGYGKPIPVDRGKDPDQKLCYKDNMELVGMHHWQLRSSPDLAPETIKPFQTIVERCSEYFYNRNKRFMDLWGYKAADCETYCSMWLLIYFHHYRKLWGTLDENKKLFTCYAQNKFESLRQVIQSKADWCFPDGESVEVAFYEDSARPSSTRWKVRVDEESATTILPFAVHHDYEATPDANDDAGYQKRNALIDKSNQKKRRASAAALLADHLLKLPHDERVRVLEEAMENEAFGYDAQMEARKQLRKHREVCSVCPNKDENMGGGDATGT